MKFIDKLAEKMVPFAQIIANNKYLLSLRDGFYGRFSCDNVCVNYDYYSKSACYFRTLGKTSRGIHHVSKRLFLVLSEMRP